MRTVSSRAPRRAAALVVASAAVLLAAACGGGSDSSGGGNATGTGGGGNNQAFTAYIDCLKKNGVTITLPSRGPRGDGASRGPGEGFPEGGFPSGMPRPSGSAFARGNGVPGGGFLQKPAGVDDATWEKAQSACASVRPSFGGNRNGGNGANAAYRNCLQQHGVTQGETPLNTADPTVKKAMETCKVLQPQPNASPTA
ncbi:hypothetical protein ACQP2F_29940 [Actinoplanes sp. CA-030573]|uniref:hypothetical protein n=1 Tax=Actinoplanes sp. CA-030573 TaxID=3239898 RepID=UPI003D8E7247